eukprot:2564593-Prymnesium_polylepis.1
MVDPSSLGRIRNCTIPHRTHDSANLSDHTARLRAQHDAHVQRSRVCMRVTTSKPHARRRHACRNAYGVSAGVI